MSICKCEGCERPVFKVGGSYCQAHLLPMMRPKVNQVNEFQETQPSNVVHVDFNNKSKYKLSQKYPKYFKDVSSLDEVDTYEINRLYPVDDPTGCILHARKKLLIPGVRTGGKTLIDDVREARDTLNRFLQIHGYDEAA